MKKTHWNSDALPYDQTLDQVLYEVRRSDSGEGLLLDAVTAQEILDDAEGVIAFDALVTPYAKLERRMELLRGIMERTGDKVKPIALQITDPFKQRGVANVAAIFELSDGQTVTIFFHNPDVTPNKMAPADEVISWKWLLNKKDITIVVAPERGADLNIREVARRIMRLAEKNSAAFQRVNATRATRMQNIQTLKDEITTLETELATAQHELEVAKVAAEGAAAKPAQAEQQKPDITYRNSADGLFTSFFPDTPEGEKAWNIINATPGAEGGKVLAAHAAPTIAQLRDAGYTVAEDTGAPVSDEEAATLFAELGKTAISAVDVKNLAKTEAAIELSGNELGDFPDTEEGKKALRDAAKGRLETIVGTWVPCPALGGDVEIRKSGVKKFISTSADARKLRLVAVLDRIIGSGRKLASRPPYDGDSDKSARAYHTLRSEVSLAGETIAVRTVVKEDTNGKFHYDMTVHAIEAVFDSAKDEGRDESQPSNMTTTNGGGTHPSRFARHQLDSIVGNDGQEFNQALDSADGAYLGADKQAISATKALLQYFRDFLASDAKFAKVPTSAYGWTTEGEVMDKDEAKRRLRSLIDIAINRKVGIPDLTPEQDKRLADYAHDARTISDYLTKRIRHTGARNLLRTAEMKAKYPHIDNQPRGELDSVALDSATGSRVVLNLFIEGEAPDAQVEWEDETPEFDQFKVVGSDQLWGEIIEVPTVYGDLVRVSKKQLAETGRNILASYTKDGKRKPGSGINRGNLLLGDAELTPAALLEKEMRESGNWEVARYPRSVEQEHRLIGMGYAPYLKTESGEIMKSGLGLVWAKPTALPEQQAAGATKEDATKAMATLRPFLSASQMQAVADAMRGEEKQFFFDKAVELARVKGVRVNKIRYNALKR